MTDLPPALFTRLRRMDYHRAQRNARIRGRLDLAAVCVVSVLWLVLIVALVIGGGR